jgi:hypothetical protein
LDTGLTQISESDMAQSLPLAVHVGALGFRFDASNKPGPGREVFGGLMDQYMADGVITGSEPLIGTQTMTAPEGVTIPWSGTLVPFSVGWIKGLARSTTLLAALHRFWKLGIKIKDHNPRFHDSVMVIYMHNVHAPSKMDEALLTMKLSSRGSIRKKTNIIQTVAIIYSLYEHGLSDFAIFIRRWNAMAARSDHIIGKRAMAVKLLFESIPRALLNRILDHVNHTGWMLQQRSKTKTTIRTNELNSLRQAETKRYTPHLTERNAIQHIS